MADTVLETRGHYLYHVFGTGFSAYRFLFSITEKIAGAGASYFVKYFVFDQTLPNDEQNKMDFALGGRSYAIFVAAEGTGGLGDVYSRSGSVLQSLDYHRKKAALHFRSPADSGFSYIKLGVLTPFTGVVGAMGKMGRIPSGIFKFRMKLRRPDALYNDDVTGFVSSISPQVLVRNPWQRPPRSLDPWQGKDYIPKD